MSIELFWDKVYAKNPTRTPNENDPTLLEAMRHFGGLLAKVIKRDEAHSCIRRQ